MTMRMGKIISRYLVASVLPYFVFSWLLLSVILFVQQAGRYSDSFFSPNVPSSLVWQLAIALIPNVIAFTCPMAALVGVIIGLAKMQGDSEIVVIRAAGIGTRELILPLAVLGVFLAAFAFAVNLYGVPLAAGIVRRVAMRTAIQKLESPIEPGVFNTEIDGYTIYVKDGDIEAGTWKNIFIHNVQVGIGNERLITSRSGRIDSEGNSSELVLRDAVVSTFTTVEGREKFLSENVGEVRIAIKTKRDELVSRLARAESVAEELGLVELFDLARSKKGRERAELMILWQRRLMLSATPFIFTIFGAFMILRFSRGGRGFGILLALISLIAYYLMAFLGEQLARTGVINVVLGSLLPLGFGIAAMIWLGIAARRHPLEKIKLIFGRLFAASKNSTRKIRGTNLFVDLTTGLRDFDIGLNLIRYYLLTLGFLGAIFLIFTGFELWKFAGTFNRGIILLLQYLFYLLPFVYLQLAPSAAMIATLATFAIKSRQNEITVWAATGQSIYRLLIPCLVLAAAAGGVNWALQEFVAPRSNQIQDDLRNFIRSRGVTVDNKGMYWVATDQRVYSFRIGASDNAKAVSAGGSVVKNGASDNAITTGFKCNPGCPLKDISIYEFTEDGTRLQTVYRSDAGVWEADRMRFTSAFRKTSLDGEKVATISLDAGAIAEVSNPLLGVRRKPSHLNSGETKNLIDSSESDVERRNFGVALARKRSTLLLPLIIALFTAPFALALSRKGKSIAIGYAIGFWLIYMAITGFFEQLGLNGSLSPEIAVWSPLILFSMFGIILLSRVRT